MNQEIRNSVIFNLSNIANLEYENKYSLDIIREEIIKYNNYIKENIDEVLYDKLKVEVDTCYYEAEYGDGEYTHLVYYDCVNVLKEVISVL